MKSMTKVFENEQKALDFITALRSKVEYYEYSYKYLKVYNDKTKDFDEFVELNIKVS